MQTPTTEIATAWSHTTAEIPGKGLDVSRDADPAQCVALATQLGILGIERLHVAYRILAASGGRFRLRGTLEARVVQACVVTLDPVTTTVNDRLEVEFRPGGDVADTPAGSPDAELEVSAAEEYEPIEDHRLAVGRIVAESLAAALPAYPRSPDAALEQHEAGPADPAPASPFAALAGWKPKPK